MTLRSSSGGLTDVGVDGVRSGDLASLWRAVKEEDKVCKTWIGCLDPSFNWPMSPVDVLFVRIDLNGEVQFPETVTRRDTSNLRPIVSDVIADSLQFFSVHLPVSKMPQHVRCWSPLARKVA